LSASANFWIVWFAVTLICTWTGLLWEINYFRSPGPQFRLLLLVLLSAFPLVLAAYHRLRRVWFSWEPLIVALPVVAGLVYEPRATLVVTLIVAATLATGAQLCAVLGLQAQGPLEKIIVTAALGFGTWNSVLFLMGLAGLYTSGALAALFTATLLLSARHLPDIWRAIVESKNAWVTEAEFRSPLGSLLVLFTVVLVVLTLMVTLAPSLSFDVNALHLPLVHYYASQHSLRTPFYLPYGYYPQSMEVLMTAGYILGGDAAAQMLPPVFFALALVTAYRIGRLCGFDRFASYAGVVFSAATPFIHGAGSVAKNDFALAFFILAAVLGYLRWRGTQNFHWVLAAAFFLAAAAGEKHIVIFAIPPLAVLFLHAALRQRTPLREAAMLAAIFLCFGLFWHARTWVLTGNPLYPQTASVAAKGVVPYHSPIWTNVILPYLRFPWRVFFHGQRYFESPLNQPLGITLALCVPFWLIVRKRITAAEAACLLFCGLYFAYWFITVEMLRFAIAPFLILYVLTVSRFVAFWRQASKPIQFSVLLASSYTLLFGLLGVAIIEVNAPQLRYFAFRIDRTGYLREALLPYRAIEFVRRASNPGDLVFGIEACAGVYAPDPSTFDCVMTVHKPPQEILGLINGKDHRFLVMPRGHPELVPPGWRKAYSDEAYEVFTRTIGLPVSRFPLLEAYQTTPGPL
jgi:hypothetical protein